MSLDLLTERMGADNDTSHHGHQKPFPYNIEKL